MSINVKNGRNMLISEIKLKESILSKFDSLQEFAKQIGYSETQISRAIKTQSVKFIAACKKAGIDIDEIILEEEAFKKDDVSDKLKAAYKRIQELEKLVEDQKDLVKYYKEMIEEIRQQKG